MIRVVDDGSGIAAEDVPPPCSACHQQIKTADDLFAVLSPGCAKHCLYCLVSRLSGNPSADSLPVQKLLSMVVSCKAGRSRRPVGTEVKVEDLFYNTPHV